MKIYRIEGTMNIVDKSGSPVTGIPLMEAMVQYNGNISLVPIYSPENVAKDTLIELEKENEELKLLVQKYRDFEEKRSNSFIGKVEKFFGIYLSI